MRTNWGRVRDPKRDDAAPSGTADDFSGALRIIDGALSAFVERGIVSSVVVVDLLLDLRSAIVLDATASVAFDELEVRDVDYEPTGA